MCGDCDSSLRKKKFKAMKKHVPAAVDDPHTEVTRFIAHLENLLVLCRKDRENWKKSSVSNFIASWLKINAGDALGFVIVHNRRHLRQAWRLDELAANLNSDGHQMDSPSSFVLPEYSKVPIVQFELSTVALNSFGLVFF
jgi:hypothetical protein